MASNSTLSTFGLCSPFPQLLHPQHPEQRQTVPGVDPPFAGGAEPVGRPGQAQIFGPFFDAVEPFDGEVAGGGEALHIGIRVGAVAGGEGIGFGPATHPVDEPISRMPVSSSRKVMTDRNKLVAGTRSAQALTF